ncbi:hypothetical protein [Shouchella patagoniensis]|uniref:hypothetical protein n=1 Tax=Shouchella patagoniensis TaxID=228576 RepID=UPI0009951B24|nr:hypothetical protein [Shouchella patagoniensis]
MEWAQKIWQPLCWLAVAFVVTGFFYDSTWLDIGFYFIVALGLLFMSVDVYFVQQKQNNWLLIVMGIVIVLFLTEGLVEVWHVIVALV